MNHLEERGNDTIQARSNSDFDIKSAPIQFYGNNHNSPFDCWIALKFYVKSPDMLSYLGFKFQINRSLERHQNTGQQRLYEFCYLLPFDLWTSYLARILFLKGCGRLFWESPNSPKIFNGLQNSFHVWQRFIPICRTVGEIISLQWFSKELKNDLSKNNSLRGVILILLVHESIFVGWGSPFPIVLVLRYKLSLCRTPIKPDLLGFPGIGVFACVFAWPRHEVRISHAC
jgi:hypothetical protein